MEPRNEERTTQIREQARALLASDDVTCVIGYEMGTRGQPRPAFIYNADEVDRLIWNEHCVHNLVNYLHDKKKPARRGQPPPRVAVVVKPCDSRAINVLLSESQIAREQIHIIGVVCTGLQDDSGAPLARCAPCSDRQPVVYDTLVGEAPPIEPAPPSYEDIAQMATLPPEERLSFWLRQFDRCIRCYACRQVCPGCYCTTCMFERDDGLWIGARIGRDEKYMFHLGRAFHLAGRCVECNECERVCPMGLPLSLLNRMLAREMLERFGHAAGREETMTPLLFQLGEEGSPI